MSLVRYEPFSLFDRLHKDLGRPGLYDSFLSEVLGRDSSSVLTSHWRPAVDIREEDARFVIEADIPGVDPKDIEITMERGVLTIKGERAAEKQDEGEGYKRVERSHGTFYRRFSLPESADANKIEAKGKDGVLTIVVPKQEKEQPRKIEVTH